jgi:hypothetical protein
MSVFLGAIKGSGKSSFPEITEAFEDWLKSDNVAKVGKDKYSVHMLGWGRSYSKKDVFKYFVQEYVTHNEGWTYFPIKEIRSVIKYLKLNTDNMYFLNWSEFQ